MEGPVTALTDLAREVRKDEYGYPEPRKDRTPEATMVGGAALGIGGAMGVNNAVQLPKRTNDALKYHGDRFKDSKAKAVAARAKYKGASRINPAKRKYLGDYQRAQAVAINDLKNIRGNQHIARNMGKVRLRTGAAGGALMAAGAGLAALGSRMKQNRDANDAA